MTSFRERGPLNVYPPVGALCANQIGNLFLTFSYSVALPGACG